MNDILKKYDDIDYRIMDIESCRESYDEFLKKLKEKRSLGEGNEYEIEGEGLDEISNKYGFYPRTAIVLFVPFMTEDKARVSDGANLSSHAFSRDYHMIVKKILNEIVDDIKARYHEAEFLIQCDNGPLNERFFAYASGLGKTGMNSMIINDIFGSYGFIGLIITDISSKEHITESLQCIKCNRCIRQCPSGAISSDGVDFSRCISYLTQKKTINSFEETLLKKQNKVFGCDVCQDVCPENKNKKYSNIEDFSRDLLYNIELGEIYDISNREFRRKFSDRNFSWKGKNIIVRNIMTGRDK